MFSSAPQALGFSVMQIPLGGAARRALRSARGIEAHDTYRGK